MDFWTRECPISPRRSGTMEERTNKQYLPGDPRHFAKACGALWPSSRQLNSGGITRQQWSATRSLCRASTLLAEFPSPGTPALAPRPRSEKPGGAKERKISRHEPTLDGAHDLRPGTAQLAEMKDFLRVCEVLSAPTPQLFTMGNGLCRRPFDRKCSCRDTLRTEVVTDFSSLRTLFRQKQQPIHSFSAAKTRPRSKRLPRAPAAKRRWGEFRLFCTGAMRLF
uniref:Uncharacterized protein n=1 Tax=Toxoplasma gondii COUG TaxID=1074873 RepID=A0A2G8YAU0_TOXGO|nr:hypothetical protein TGCOUG_391640 [Toxoplasma gondii COUG]